MRRAAELIVLLAAIAFAAYLRFVHLADVSLWVDELAFLMETKVRWWQWLIGFDPEHGPLYHATLAAGRLLFASPELAARSFEVLAGLAALPVGWVAARRLHRDGATSIVFPILLAVSPLHVYYSREGRPYALLMLFAIGLTTAMLLRARLVFMALLVLATLYTSAAAAPLLIAFVIVAASVAFFERRPFFGYAVLGAGGLALIPALYRERYGVVKEPWHGLNHALVRSIAESLSVIARDAGVHHPAALVFLVLAILGAIALLRRDRANGVIVIGMALLPLVITIAVLIRLNHWYEARYICPALPAYLLLVAEGVACVAELASRRALEFSIAVVVAVLLAWQGLPAAREEPLRKPNWRGVANAIWSHAQHGDWMVATSIWAQVSVNYYLGLLPPRVRVIGNAPEVAERWQGVWIVSAGPAGDPAWTCRYPTVLTDPPESQRIHYAPSVAHFLATRSTAAERHALALTAIRNDRFVLSLGADDDAFLIDGWAPPNRNGDDEDRWIVGTHASFVAPFDTPANRRLTIRAHAFAMIPQVMQVSINGTAVAAFPLTPEYRDHSCDIDASRWRADRANIIALDFATATTPSNVDRRKLAAAITAIDIRPRDAAAQTVADAPRAYVVRLNGFPMTPIASRRRVAPAKRAPLIASLGVDPAHAVNSAETLAQSLVDMSGCLDDAAFVHVARSAIVDARDRGGDRYFLDFLRQGGTRSKVIDVLLDELNRKSDVFRRSTPYPLTHF